MKRQHVSGGTTWHRKFCTSPAITSHHQLQMRNCQQLPREGWSHPTFSAALLGQLPVHLSDLLFSPDSSSPSRKSQGWVAGHICRTVSPSEGTQDPRMALVAQWYQHRPESCPHGGAVPSWEQAHGATLGTMKPATLACWQSMAGRNSTATHLSKEQSSAEKWGVCFLNRHFNKHRMKHVNGQQLIIYKNCRFSVNLNCNLAINNTVSLSTF